MKKSVAERIVKLARNYDLYTQYIDSYRQELQARESNKHIEEEIEILTGKSNVRYLIECIKNDYRDNYTNTLKYVSDFVGEEINEDKKIWTEEEIKYYVQTNDTVLYNALRKLYACQTADEQQSGVTNIQNGVGFNGADAPILTSFAQFLERTGFLTYRQKELCRKKLKKYNRQLTRLANA